MDPLILTVMLISTAGLILSQISMAITSRTMKEMKIEQHLLMKETITKGTN